MSEFHREDERCDFQVGRYFGEGGGEGGGAPRAERATYPTSSSVPTSLYLRV